MDQESLTTWVDSCWDESIIPALTDYIRILCKSPLFDPEWESAGHIEAAVELSTSPIRPEVEPRLRRLAEDLDRLGMEEAGAALRRVFD